jgi:imidazole glycerol phosphate synthase glutamine amidotransferase subunit
VRAAGGAAPQVAVVDYGAGNLVSIEQALTTVGARVRIARDAAPLTDPATVALVVPGVGAAGPAMTRLGRYRLIEPIRDWIRRGRPYLGICLGLQLLFEGSDEDGAATLGILAGRTRRLVDAPTLPHIGWNQVERRRSHPLFDGIDEAADFYFVHSYVGVPASEAAGGVAPRAAGTSPTIGDPSGIVLAETTHGAPFVSAIAAGPILGVQFHPERSGDDGLALLRNFVRSVA